MSGVTPDTITTNFMSTRHQYYNQDNLFFVTTTIKDWINIFDIETYKKILIDTLTFCIEKYSVDLIAYVIMPNHIHFILFFKEKTKLSDFMRDFKKYSSRQIRLELQKDNNINILELIRFQKGEQLYKVWQDGFDAKIIRGNDMLITKIEYIHNNPVRKGLVENAEEWEDSSAGFYSGKENKYFNLRNAGEIM